MTGELVGGRYELEELAGSGGMSSVYRAHDRLLERKVALKILHQRYGDDDEYVERFRREARAVAQLAHPNIVTVIDRGEDEGRQFIVFEYVEGENLKQLVERVGPLPIGDVLELGTAVASGLAFAHERGIVHRDVKPQNVLLNGDGRAKVTDFGIARSLDVEHGVTQTGTVLGTSNYIAPEQAGGKAVSRESDVYSLGVVLFELLTGRVPFDGESFVAVAMQHLSEPPPSVLSLRPDTPPRLAQLIDAALAKDPSDRPSMEQVVAELEALRVDGAAHDTIATTPVAARRRARARSGSRSTPWPLLLAGLGAVLLGLAFGAFFLTRDDGGGEGGAATTAGPIAVHAVESYDPDGDDGSEHPEAVPRATDHDPATYWPTSQYYSGGGSFGKPGVGIVLETARPAKELVLESDTPGFTAEVRANDAAVSPARTVASRTTIFPLNTQETRLVLWLTNRGPNAAVHVNEVSAR